MLTKKRMIWVALLAAGSLALMAAADAAPQKHRRPAKSQWKGYGFLPGYPPAEAAAERRKGKKSRGVNRVERDINGRRLTPVVVYRGIGYPGYLGYPDVLYPNARYPYRYPYGYRSVILSDSGYPNRYPTYYTGYGVYNYGGPGFSQGRWNGGSFGPCWTRTPIGPIWNCGR